MSSLILDTGNFGGAYIDEKKVHQMFFQGDKIYDSTKWYAYGNKWTGTYPNSLWGGTGEYLFESGNATGTSAKVITGHTGASNKKLSSIYLTDKNRSSFENLSSSTKNVSISDALNIMGLESMTQCDNVYYVTRFSQTTYDGDILVKPIIYALERGNDLPGGSIDFNNVFDAMSAGVYISKGIGTEYADETDNGFCWIYTKENKGRTVTKVFQLTNDQIESIELRMIPWYLCKAFKTNDDTTSTKATAYYGGYLLLECH